MKTNTITLTLTEDQLDTVKRSLLERERVGEELTMTEWSQKARDTFSAVVQQSNDLTRHSSDAGVRARIQARLDRRHP